MKKKRTALALYNYYKKDYAKYLLLIKRKNKLITYSIDAKIISFLFKIDYAEEIILDNTLFNDLLELKEIYHFNIAVVDSKIREYYCHKLSDYLRLKNKSKKYVKELENVEYGEKWFL